jgi:hypothetical protein
MWMIRRLKALGASNDELVDVYAKQVRSILEQAVAVWSPSLTLNQAAQIERVQKTFCAVVLGPKYIVYPISLSVLDLSTLDERRQNQCSNFGKKCVKSQKYQNWFVPKTNDPDNVQTRSDKTGLVPGNARTKSYRKSPLPYLTEQLSVCKSRKI